MNKPTIVRHGEVILKPISELPKGVVQETEVQEYVVAHSETGHHHVLQVVDRGEPMTVFVKDGTRYIWVKGLSELFHQKTGEYVHAPHKIAPAIYEVVIKKSFNYFSKMLERVRD